MGQGLVLTHSTDSIPVVADAAARVLVVRTEAEAEAPRAARVRAERTRPVVAVVPVAVERTVPAEAGGGKKETVTIGAGEAATVHAVLRCPLDGGVVNQFLPLFLCWGTTAIVGCGGIVAKL